MWGLWAAAAKRSSFDGQTTQTVGTMVGWMASSGIGCCGASRDSMCGTIPEYTMTLYDDATCDTEIMTLNGVSMISGLEGPSSQGFQCIEGDNGIAGALSQKGQCAGEDKLERDRWMRRRRRRRRRAEYGG